MVAQDCSPASATPGHKLDVSKEVIHIIPDGDLILDLTHDSEEVTHNANFKVDSSVLQATSKYFEKLLAPDRFGEGQEVKEQSHRLRQIYGELKNVPDQELPTLHIEHIGRISNVRSISALLTDFFSILHGLDKYAIPPIANLANLAIVADRFDALSAVAHLIRRKKIIEAVDRKTTSKQEASLSEERLRQRLLVGLLLDHSPWVEKYSARLITRCCVTEATELPDTLWWDLPGRIEEELAFRRQCVLQTLQDLQTSFLDLYSSRARQCRLGYESSAQCDRFQLGEMIRFFLRIGSLRLQGTLQPSDASYTAFSGDLYTLIEQMRQVPEYQIDQFHSHCGIRTRLIPALTLIAGALSHIGVCGDCWRETRNEERWSLAKRPLQWGRIWHVSFGSATSHESRHDLVRSLFMAEQRQWD